MSGGAYVAAEPPPHRQFLIHHPSATLARPIRAAGAGQESARRALSRLRTQLLALAANLDFRPSLISRCTDLSVLGSFFILFRFVLICLCVFYLDFDFIPLASLPLTSVHTHRPVFGLHWISSLLEAISFPEMVNSLTPRLHFAFVSVK